MKDVKLSIIVPTLNEENYIGKLLDSLKNQTFQSFEVIVIDANSKDKTMKVVKGFSRFLKVRYINFGKKIGTGAQRNFGVKKSLYNKILFLDADVVLSEDFLQIALDEMEHRKLEVSSCYILPLSNNILDKIIHWFNNFYMRIYQYKEDKRAYGACLFSRKNLHNKIKGFDEKIKICEDYDYVRRVSKYTKFRMLKKPKIYVSVRRFEEKGRLKMIKEYLKIEYHRKTKGNITKNGFGYDFD